MQLQVFSQSVDFKARIEPIFGAYIFSFNNFTLLNAL